MTTRASRLGFLVALAFSATSCHKPIVAVPGQPFELRMHQAARVKSGDLDLYFARVASDSRCPRGVECVAAGDAVVTLEGRIMKGPAEPIDVRLAGGAAGAPDSSTEVTWQGYWIRLTRLEPYPVSGAPRDTLAYVGTFVVGKR